MKYKAVLIAVAAVGMTATACDTTSITGPNPATKTGLDLVSAPLEFDVPWAFHETNPCNLDEVAAEGKMHVVFNDQFDATGGLHHSVKISWKGSGVGVPSTVTYQVVEKNTESLQDPVGPQFSYQEEHQVVMAAPRPAITYVRHVLVKITFNANGTQTADVGFMFNKCQGDGEKVDITT